MLPYLLPPSKDFPCLLPSFLLSYCTSILPSFLPNFYFCYSTSTSCCYLHFLCASFFTSLLPYLFSSTIQISFLPSSFLPLLASFLASFLPSLRPSLLPSILSAFFLYFLCSFLSFSSLLPSILLVSASFL